MVGHGTIYTLGPSVERGTGQKLRYWLGDLRGESHGVSEHSLRLREFVSGRVAKRMLIIGHERRACMRVHDNMNVHPEMSDLH